MSYVRGADRSEVQLLPACMDDYVDRNAPVRFIDAFVEQLDFVALGFTHARPAATGRPSYHPADLLKLYTYGYLNRLRSSRRLEAEANRNLEVMWLMRGVRPDFKTIADFRRDNRHAFKEVFKQFNLLCRKLDLFGAELVAIDGSKFKAVNNPRRSLSQEQLQELIKTVEQRIEAYLHELDQRDDEAEGTSGSSGGGGLQEKIAQLKEHKSDYEQLLEQIKETGQKKISLTDADSRTMREGVIGYNVQVAVDAKHDLIVESEVVQSACDRHQLSPMAIAAKDQLEANQLQVVADAGYHEADQLEQCEQHSIETYVPDTGKSSGQSKGGKTVFPKEQFAYDAATDSYRCPGAEMLSRKENSKRKGKVVFHYHNRRACRQCQLRSQCTTAAFRIINRRANEAVIERQAKRLATKPQMLKLRRSIVEHVFGTMRRWHYDNFLMKGLSNVRAEFSLTALAYNLRRVLNLKNVTDLIAF